MSRQKGKQPFAGVAVFDYTSVCCGAKATKDPCVRSKEYRKENKFSECCKVRRTKVKKEEPKEENGVS